MGNYQVVASFAGAINTAPFTIERAKTHLTIDPSTPIDPTMPPPPPTATPVPQVAAVLTGDDGRTTIW